MLDLIKIISNDYYICYYALTNCKNNPLSWWWAAHVLFTSYFSWKNT